MTNTETLAHKICKTIAKNAGAEEYTRKNHARVVELLNWPYDVGEARPELVQQNYDNAVLFLNHRKTKTVDQLLTMHDEDGLVDTPWCRLSEPL